MRIAILSRNRYLYSTRRLLQAARSRGHQVRVVDTLWAARQLGVTPSDSSTRHHRPWPDFDAIIPRIGASITAVGVDVVHVLENKGAVTTAAAEAIALSRDKLKSLRLMQRTDLPHPKTVLISELDGIQEAVEAVGGPPVVIKVLTGTQGRGVILAPTFSSVHTVLSIFFRYGQEQMLLQEYIEEADGRDLRLFIVGRRCVAAMQRRAPEGDFRANLHRGATSTSIRPDELSEELAVQAASNHGLGVAGVDIIPSVRGPLLLEVNSSPGLEGIEDTTGVNVATEVVRYLEQEARNAGKLGKRRRLR